MSLPYLPLFVDDYEAHTAHLSLIEDGIYNRLLRLCWRTPRCQIPNDREWIARKVRAFTKAEKEALENVLNEFFKVRRGFLFQKRLSEEFVRVSESVQKRKTAGKIGGSAKALKNKEKDPSNATAMPAYVRVPYPEPEPNSDRKPTGFLSAQARKKPRGWVTPRTHIDAANTINSEPESHELGRIENRHEGAGGDVQHFPAIANGGR